MVGRMINIEKPLITTIIPTYKRPNLLRRAILSVLNQTYDNFQVCVYDNASGDETKKIVEKLSQNDSRIKYFCHEQNIGVEKNLQFGLNNVTTKYFSFLSDDDYLLPNFYKTTVEKFLEYPSAGFVAGSVITVSEDGKVLDVPLEHWDREGLYSYPEGFATLTMGDYPTWTGILFNSNVLSLSNNLDIDVGGAADLNLILSAAANYDYIISKIPCAVYFSLLSQTRLIFVVIGQDGKR